MARPRLKIDEKQLFALAQIQCTLPEMAAVLGCCRRTLQNERFCALIKKGKRSGKASLRRIQYKLATGGNATMAIWLGKQLLGQSDRAAHEHTGRNGGPIQTEVRQTLNVEQLERDLRQLASGNGNGYALSRIPANGN